MKPPELKAQLSVSRVAARAAPPSPPCSRRVAACALADKTPQRESARENEQPKDREQEGEREREREREREGERARAMVWVWCGVGGHSCAACRCLLRLSQARGLSTQGNKKELAARLLELAI